MVLRDRRLFVGVCGGVALSLFACSLFTSLDDLEGDPAGGRDSGYSEDIAPPFDAKPPPVVLEAGSDAQGDSGATLSAYALAVLADSPIAYWRLGETSGTTARDEKGQFDGVYRGSPMLGAQGSLPRDSDKAVFFPGPPTSTYVELGDVGALELERSPFTIEAWAKIDEFVGQNNNYYERYIVSKLGNSGGGWHLWAAAPWIDTQGSHSSGIGFDLNTGTRGFGIFFPYSLPTAFDHFVVTFDNATLAVFINADEKARNPADAGAGNGTAPFSIGAGQFFNNGYFGGLIDEVAIYNHALPLARIQAHYMAR